MSSGWKQIVENTAERVVSTDVNRLQSLVNKEIAEVMRYLCNVSAYDDDVHAGRGVAFGAETLTSTSPASADIYGGLMVVPAVGSLGLSVTPGLIGIIDPDAVTSTDDSAYKIVYDAGGSGITRTPTGAVLAMTANTGISTRIDVIECRRVEDPADETASRDIYSVANQAFTSRTVQKSTGSVLQYRVRTGTVGGGWPGAASDTGWVPLAVVNVPNGATTNDLMTFWDVRPLVHDRVLGPYTDDYQFSKIQRCDYAVNAGGSGAVCKMSGVVEASVGGYRVGGLIQRGSPGSDPSSGSYVDFAETNGMPGVWNNAEVTLVGTATGFAYVYLCAPFGLPRWARYTDYTTGQRLPRSPRGIPLLSGQAPEHAHGYNASLLTFPAVFGFGTGASQMCAIGSAVCVGTVQFWNSSPAYTPVVCRNKVVNIGNNCSYTVNGSAAAQTGTFTLAENTAFPVGAKRLKLGIMVQFTIPVATPNFNTVGVSVNDNNMSLTMYQTATGAGTFESFARTRFAVMGCDAETETQTCWGEVWIEVPNGYQSDTAQSYTVTYGIDLHGDQTVGAAPVLSVQGWEL